MVATREALSVVRTHQPEPREGQAGPAGWRMGLYYRRSRITLVEGRSPDSRVIREG